MPQLTLDWIIVDIPSSLLRLEYYCAHLSLLEYQEYVLATHCSTDCGALIQLIIKQRRNIEQLLLACLSGFMILLSKDRSRRSVRDGFTNGHSHGL